MKTGIAKAEELAQAGKDAIMDLDVMLLASQIVKSAKDITEDELIHLMFKYSGTLAASVSARLTSILMTESELNEMISDIQMFDEIGKSVLGE